MKYLVLMAFIVSCSSNRDVPVGKIEVNPGATYDYAEKGWGKPKECKEIGNMKYCDFSDKYAAFKDEVLVETLKQTEKELKFNVEVATEGKISSKGKKVYIHPTKTSDWNSLYPYFKGIFTANGFEVVDSPKNSDVTANITYGIKNQSSAVSFKKWGDKSSSKSVNSNTRFIEISGAGGGQKWTLTSESTGYLADMNVVVPVLATTLADAFEYGPNTTISGEIENTSLNVQAFKHFSNN